MYIMYIYNQYSLFFFFFFVCTRDLFKIHSHIWFMFTWTPPIYNLFSRDSFFYTCNFRPWYGEMYSHVFILSHVIRIIITLWNPRDHKVGVLFLCTGLPCSDLHTRDPDVQVHRFAVRRETCSRWASVHERKRRKEKPTLQILTEALLYIQYTR